MDLSPGLKPIVPRRVSVQSSQSVRNDEKAALGLLTRKTPLYSSKNPKAPDKRKGTVDNAEVQALSSKENAVVRDAPRSSEEEDLSRREPGRKSQNLKYDQLRITIAPDDELGATGSQAQKTPMLHNTSNDRRGAVADSDEDDHAGPATWRSSERELTIVAAESSEEDAIHRPTLARELSLHETENTGSQSLNSRRAAQRMTIRAQLPDDMQHILSESS